MFRTEKSLNICRKCVAADAETTKSVGDEPTKPDLVKAIASGWRSKASEKRCGEDVAATTSSSPPLSDPRP